jgi:hypothetical protein
MAEHGALLRLDLIVPLGAAHAALAEPDGEEDREDADDEHRLDDRSADAAVGDYPRESSHSPPVV